MAVGLLLLAAGSKLRSNQQEKQAQTDKRRKQNQQKEHKQPMKRTENSSGPALLAIGVVAALVVAGRS